MKKSERERERERATKLYGECILYLIEYAHSQHRQRGVHDIIERDEVLIVHRLGGTHTSTHSWFSHFSSTPHAPQHLTLDPTAPISPGVMTTHGREEHYGHELRANGVCRYLIT